MKTARRVAQVQPFHVMDLLARARELEAAGRDIVHMEIGEPDFPTPEPILEAGRNALAGGRIHYTQALGLPALRQAISDYYDERFGIDVEAARIVVTPGSSVGLQMVMTALVDAGEEVLLTDPGYPCNRNFVYLVDGRPLSLDVSAGCGFQPTMEDVEAAWTDATRALMVATPANPTGSLISLSELGRLSSLVASRGGALIVDEIYQGLTYDVEDVTALSLAADNVIVLNSFSKYFGMTGWRVGWLVVPPSLVPIMDKLAQNMYLSAPTVSQHAAIEALKLSTRPLLDQRRDEFRRRRDFLHTALQGLGFKLSAIPEGAFYFYADCSEFTDDSHRFSRALLEEVGVAVTPGRDFGHNRPESHVRFAFTTTIDRMIEGVRRIDRFINGQ